MTDPELKGGGVPLASRRGSSSPVQQKKRPVLCFSCHLRCECPKAGCCTGQECAVPKITDDASDRKTSPDAPGFVFDFCFGPVDPNTTRGHRQTPPNAASRSHPNTPRTIFLAAGGSIPPPFGLGSVRASCWGATPHAPARQQCRGAGLVSESRGPLAGSRHSQMTEQRSMENFW